MRPEDRAFLQGSVAFLARTPRSIFALDEAISVMHSAQALLLRVSGGKPPFGRRGVAPGPCGQLGRTLLSEVMARLVTSLRAAPDHCAMAAIWPTPEQDQEYLERRALAAGGDNNSGDRDGSGGVDAVQLLVPLLDECEAQLPHGGRHHKSVKETRWLLVRNQWLAALHWRLAG